MDIKTALKNSTNRLRMRSATPELDAQVILAHSLGQSRSWLLAHPEEPIGIEKAAVLEAAVQRLVQGEPLPYVLGKWEFFGLSFEVTPDVLIPRPETELLVERALDWLHHRPVMRSVLDVGTGSGCIGITLAVNIPDLYVTASDISSEALAVARRNAHKLGVAKQITFLKENLIPESQFTIPYSLIAANLPYIPHDALDRLPAVLREPKLALDGGVDGLTLIHQLMKKAPTVLVAGGLILMEIEASEGPAVLSIANDIFTGAEIHLRQDLAGHDRLVEIQFSAGQ